jgi:hypothetical protein
MELDRAELSPGGASSPTQWSPSALGQACSEVLHRLTGHEARRASARRVALKDFSALIETTEWDRLLEGSGQPLRRAAETLGQVTKALEKYAAPPKEEACAGSAHSEVPEKAVEVGVLFLRLLEKVEAGKNCLVCPAWKTVLGHLAGPIYIFAITHLLEQPWTSPRSREVAGEVRSSLLKVTQCSSVAGFLRGENEDERFPVIMGLLKPYLNK